MRRVSSKIRILEPRLGWNRVNRRTNDAEKPNEAVPKGANPKRGNRLTNQNQTQKKAKNQQKEQTEQTKNKPNHKTKQKQP